MSTVNNSQISTKDNLITSSATGLLAGAGFALAGYNSRPYLKDGVISDAFVRNVESHLANKLSGGSDNKKLIESFSSFIDEIGKATSYSKMAEANYNFFNRISPDKSFNGVKEVIKQSLLTMMENLAIPNTYTTDVMLDYYNDINKAENIQELKAAINYYYISGSYKFENFESMRSSLKEALERNKNELLGFDADVSVKKIIEALFDWKSGKFVQRPDSGVTKDIFNVISDTAKSMQWKTAAKWGGIAAAIFGGAMFLLQKFSNSKSKPVKSKPQSKVNQQVKDRSKANTQSQSASQHKSSIQSKSQTDVQKQGQQNKLANPQAQVTPKTENTEQEQSTNLLQIYKKNKN